jgi:beta-ribofuranosylaminobenzene 5'-phosphate synthase
MWSVRTASRLHLGLLTLPPATTARRFGGVGLMIDSPGMVVRAEPSAKWIVEGSHKERVSEIIARLLAGLGILEPRRVVVEQAPPEHVGLGTGTQLALAVARLLTASWGRLDLVADLAFLVKRGTRSALGVHGFDRGGFLVEGGKGPGQALSPLVSRLEFPAQWRIVLVVPPGEAGVHGAAERAAFADLVEPPDASDRLCRLVLLGVLPALADADFPAFGEAVHEFNARAGDLFAPIQGGTYAGSVRHTVAELRRLGVAGVGQSSWGPGVFAFVRDEDEANHLAGRVRAWAGFADASVWVARGCNHGARSYLDG